MKKLMMMVGAVVALATTAFGATSVPFADGAMSVAQGKPAESDWTVKGKTLTANLKQGDYKNIGSNDSLNRKGEGWYVGAAISWPKVTKKDYHATTVNKVVHVKDGVTYTGVEGFKESGLTVDGKYFIALLANDVAHSTAWELFTAEDLYAAHGADIVRELKLSGGIGGTINVEVPVTTFQIRVPTTGLTELKDGDGVVRFPAVAVKNDGEKVWGDINQAFAQFDTGTLKLEADVTSTANLNFSATLDLNGHALTVTGGEVVFKKGSIVKATSAGQIVANGGSVSAEVGSSFTFQPDPAWFASGLTVKENEGVWTVVYDHVHKWEISAVGTTVTANCTSELGTCEYGNRVAMMLEAETVVFDKKPHGATLTGTSVETFEKATGLEVGEIGYYDAAGELLAGTPKYTGRYVAKVDVGEMTIEKPFSITKPDNGYTDGWVLAKQDEDEDWWVCYESVSNAALHASNGDTIYYRGQETGEIYLDRETDFSSDVDITVDLGGKTFTRNLSAEMHICNWLDGKVTLVNGTLKQPTNGILVEDIHFDGKAGCSGVIVLGKGIVVVNVAVFSGFLKLHANGIELDVVGGEYDIAALGVSDNGRIAITGGRFGLRDGHPIEKDNLAKFVDPTCEIKEISGDYKYEVVPRTFTLTPGEVIGPYDFQTATAVMGETSFAPTEEVRVVLEGSTSITVSDYTAMFKSMSYVVGDKYYITYALTEKATNDLIQSVNRMEAKIDLAEIAALPSGETTSLALEDGVPGFYYSLFDGAALADIAPDANENNLDVLCDKDGKVSFPEVKKPSDASGFFMIHVSPEPEHTSR